MQRVAHRYSQEMHELCAEIDAIDHEAVKRAMAALNVQSDVGG